MSEMHTSIHDLPDGGIMVRCEQDLTNLVDEYAERIQRRVDAATLDKVAGTLAGFGYVKVVRCRDCRHKASDGDWCYRTSHEFTIEPNGFCAWGKRRDGA